jgi:hypothetical protein
MADAWVEAAPEETAQRGLRDAANGDPSKAVTREKERRAKIEKVRMRLLVLTFICVFSWFCFPPELLHRAITY